MNCLEDYRVSCPYCGENFDVVVDCSLDDQCYVEDCAVCCQPVVLSIRLEGGLEVVATREND